MDETLLFPSPNWFLVSNFAISKDGWMIYGGPSKGICVIEPRNPDDGVISTSYQSYRAHVALRVHTEKIVSVDLSPEFLEKRNFLSGSVDGCVNQWTLVNINNRYKIQGTHTHDVHSTLKEEVVGVGYSTASTAISVGCMGHIVKWDLNSNVCKTYSSFLTRFRVTCMACSPHIPHNVAFGTKQGVIFVIDLSTAEGKMIYKIRSQDEEIMNVSWCPQYEVLVSKIIIAAGKRTSASARMEAIRNAPDTDALEQSGISKKLADNSLEQGKIQKLPVDSFDESIVEEDDMFDIYKDHEAEEFGHKKYQPEDIVVKVKEEKPDLPDFLAECSEVKQKILKRKNEEEPTIESLVEAMDKTHVNNTSSTDSAKSSESQIKNNKGISDLRSLHPQKHLLAIIGKNSSVRVFNKVGKLMSSLPQNAKTSRQKAISWPTVLWYTPDKLLFVDAKSQLVECNPLQPDSKNKLDSRVVHSFHKRGLFAIVSDAPRVQKAYDSLESPDFHGYNNWSIYSVSQDRQIIRYNIHNDTKLAVHYTCGGYLYNVQFCPYDAGKMAVSVGDGAVRVWRSSTLPDDDTRLFPGQVQTYWNNVQGKVLSGAWHPTKENLLAFGTAESRVGLLNISGVGERPARVLYPALSGGVYSLSWGNDAELYAVGGGSLVVYRTDEPDEVPQEIEVIVEGQKWIIGYASWSPRGLLVGSQEGAVALLDPGTYETQAVAFVISKAIQLLEWHPQQTSNSSDESPYKNLIAMCSLDKHHYVHVLEYRDNEDGGKELATWKTLAGHTHYVLQAAWNPHREELLLSTSQDHTVRVWDVVAGTCVSIFGNHMQNTMGAAWLAMPQFDTRIASGGADHCLRLWDYRHHPVEAYEQFKHESLKVKKLPELEQQVATQQIASLLDTVPKNSKRFLLPLLSKQMGGPSLVPVRRLFNKLVKKSEKETTIQENGDESESLEYDFLNIFGSMNDVNELLNKEAAHLLEESPEGWISLAIFRGNIAEMIQFASQRDMLCPYLLTMAPCVSYKYWKEVSRLYIAQIDRMIAKGEDKLLTNRAYGGATFVKATTLLSIHDIKGAVEVLTEARLFKEAYILCRVRYMDSVAEETLRKWAATSFNVGNIRISVICHLVLGNWSEAASMLARFQDQEALSLAADIAKVSGRTTFADQVEKKAQAVKDKTGDVLGDLPSRIELLMNDVQKCSEVQNDDQIETDDKKPSNDDAVQDVLGDLPSRVELLMNDVQKCSAVQNDDQIETDDKKPSNDDDPVQDMLGDLPSRVELLNDVIKRSEVQNGDQTIEPDGKKPSKDGDGVQNGDTCKVDINVE